MAAHSSPFVTMSLRRCLRLLSFLHSCNQGQILKMVPKISRHTQKKMTKCVTWKSEQRISFCPFTPTHLSIGIDGREAAGRRLYPSMKRISTFDSLCSDIHLFVNTMHTDRKRLQAKHRTYICKCVLVLINFWMNH